MGDSVVVKIVYRKCIVMLPNKVTLFDLVEVDIFYFDIILGIDCLNECFASIDCRTRVVKFQFPNEPILEWKGEFYDKGSNYFCLKDCKMIAKGCLYHVVRVKNQECETLLLSQSL